MLLAARVAGFASDFSPFEGAKPLVVLIESNPWAMVIGSDTPQYVLYETREALFFRHDGFYRHQLSDEEFRDVMTRVTAVTRVGPLKRFIDVAPDITDQPSADFYLDGGEKRVATRVYGLSTRDHPMAPYTGMSRGSKADKLPRELGRLYHFLHTRDYPRSRRWLPRYIEVMIWPYEYAPDASIHWPRDWPSLDSERAIKRGDMYSIYLDSVLLPELKRFLRTRRETGAIEIGGKKWAADYRYVFPSEPAWRRALERARSSSD
jgi:hypothetical protein